MALPEVRCRMPVLSMAPILGVEILCLVAVGTGIGGTQKSNAQNALPPPSVGLNITLAVAALLFLLAILRTVGLSVVFRRDDLEIHNFWRTKRVPWDDIVGVAPPRYGHYRRAGIRVFARNGQIISASAFIQGRFGGSDRGEQVTAQIQARIATTSNDVPPSAA